MMEGTNLYHTSNTRKEEQSSRMEYQNRGYNAAGWRYSSTIEQEDEEEECWLPLPLFSSFAGGPCTATSAAGWDDDGIPTSSYYNTDNNQYPQYQQESSTSPRPTSSTRGAGLLVLEDLTSSPTVVESIPVFSQIHFPRGNDDYSDYYNHQRYPAPFSFVEQETNNMILPRRAVLPPKTTSSNADNFAGAGASWFQTISRNTKSSKCKRTGSISSGPNSMLGESHTKASLSLSTQRISTESLSAKSEEGACISAKEEITKTASLGHEHLPAPKQCQDEKMSPLTQFMEGILELHDIDDIEMGLATAVEMPFVASQKTPATDHQNTHASLVPPPTGSGTIAVENDSHPTGRGTIAVEENSHNRTSLSIAPKHIIAHERDGQHDNTCAPHYHHHHHYTPHFISRSSIQTSSTPARSNLTSSTAAMSVNSSTATMSVTSSSAACNATRMKAGNNAVSVTTRTFCILKRTLVEDSDRTEATGFSFAVLKQLERCAFDQNDKRGKRTKIPAFGFPGMACRHCKGASSALKPKTCSHGRTGRYFPTTLKTLSDSKKSLDAMYSHMLKCKQCPSTVKEGLTKLKLTHAQERKLKTHGSQKRFFSNIWNRLHGITKDTTH